MIEMLHTVGSRIRHLNFLKQQNWLWEAVEPTWQGLFALLSKREGFLTHINDDVFRLEYVFGSRYDRRDKQVYEPVIYQTFIERIEEGMHVFDIGAHIGVFTLGAAKRVGKNGRVYAFEPSPETAKILSHHVSLNGFEDRVEIVRAVVSDVDGTVSFYTHGLTMSASLSRRSVEVISPERFTTPAAEIQAPSVTLEQFCKARNIKLDVVKIDVEGAELLVLRGARSLLTNNSVQVICEIHTDDMMGNCGSSRLALAEFLDGIGYDSVAIDEPNELGIYHSLLTRSESIGMKVDKGLVA